jgi:hypothetical protein
MTAEWDERTRGLRIPGYLRDKAVDYWETIDENMLHPWLRAISNFVINT